MSLVSQLSHGGQLKHRSVTPIGTSHIWGSLLLRQLHLDDTFLHPFLDMGTMAAWFGCLIMLQLLLFMSKKEASRKIVTQNDP